MPSPKRRGALFGFSHRFTPLPSSPDNNDDTATTTTTPTNHEGTTIPRCPPRILTRRRRMTLYVIASIILLFSGLILHLYRVELSLNRPWTPTPQDGLFASRPLPPPPDPAFHLYPHFTLPLRARGRDIVDATGRRFPLASVNWYGASDREFIPGGLDIRHRSAIAASIRELGFNSVRLPYSDELVVKDPEVPISRISANPDLIASPDQTPATALQVYRAVVKALTDEGIAVIINNHITHATWCCGADPCDTGWSNSHLPPGLCRVTQTEDQWVRNWRTIMSPFRGNPGVIGADLRNEVRGLWGTMPWSKWAVAAERAGDALLELNPDWLVIVGGVSSGNDLSGVAKRPVRLGSKQADPETADEWNQKVLYSSHVYSWSGWGSKDGRFARREYEAFAREMYSNWGYLLASNKAPVWVGEFGAPCDPGVGDANYWKNLMRYLGEVDADFGYWAVNPRKPDGNVTETYSLLGDDWRTPVMDYRLRDMRGLIEGWGHAREVNGDGEE